MISAIGGGGNSLLFGIGGFGSNDLGTLKASFSQNATITWGPFSTVDVDTAHLVTCVAGHVYRVVFYFTGMSGGANLCLLKAGSSGSGSAGYFVGNSNTFSDSGSSYSGLGANTNGGSVLNDNFSQIAEVYLWVRGASNNRVWTRGFGAEWFGVDDSSVDFTTNQLELGIVGSATNIYAYDLGAVPAA